MFITFESWPIALKLWEVLHETNQRIGGLGADSGAWVSTMAKVHDTGIIIKASNLGFRQQLKLKDLHHLGTLPDVNERPSKKKKEKPSVALERLNRSPYLAKLPKSPRQRPKLITYKKEIVAHRLPSGYKYFQTVEFRRPSNKGDVESMQEDCCHETDTSSEDNKL